MVAKNNTAHVLLQLSLIADVGPATIYNLIEKVGADNLLNLHQLKSIDLQALGLSQVKANLIWHGLQDERLLAQELNLIAKYQVKWTTILDSDYPNLLRHIQGAPTILYWRGNLLQWPQQALSVVGSREANNYAKNVINQIVPSLVQAGYAIVSGGALGVDTMAHRATLDAGGTTIVVCGTGLAHNYPVQNIKLYDQIAHHGGAIVSSFNMNMTGLPGNFPARNRLISGLSHGCLVVQAAIKSGAKITAQFALEQGRELFVVPGLFGDPLSAGCHVLAQNGAKLVHQVEDILVELMPGRKPVLQQIMPSVVLQAKIPFKSACDLDNLIINLCSTPIALDELVNQLDMQMDQLQDRLFDLQLQGHVKQNFVGLWERG